MSHTPIVVLPPLFESKETLDDVLYPLSEPFDQGYLKVSYLHSIFYAQYGNPQGVPLLVVHGGPGAGCAASSARHADPKYYRIILVDQRGAPQSKPAAELKENNTENLIEDFEKLRKHLGIDKWVLLGGSWGVALSLSYGEAHPGVILGFVLRGVFLGTTEEMQSWTERGKSFPEKWDELLKHTPLEERDDIIKGLYERVTDKDPKKCIEAAKTFAQFGLGTQDLFGTTETDKLLEDENFLLCISRIFCHYFVNNCFLKENQLLENISKVAHLPAIIVHGRHDLVTKPQAAYDLHKSWPGSKLLFVPDGAHSLLDPSMSKALRQATDDMREKHIR
jgi:proline iminopeptidase